MTHALPLYPAYRDSGVDWLGEIPAHWKVQRLKFAALINPRTSELKQLPPETEVSFLPMERIGENGLLDLGETRPIQTLAGGYTSFKDGDVLIAKIPPCYENGKGALCAGLIGGIGFGTTELHVLRTTTDLDPKFLFYLTRASDFRAIGAAMMDGAAGQKRVPQSFLENTAIGIPPLSEQHSIAAFLDRETARLDALIAKKERLLALLAEKRAALISHAVTKGLDPSVSMRDSGIAWLGEIPTHWEIAPLRRVIDKFVDYRGQTPEKVPVGIRLITARNVKNGRIDFGLSEEFIREEDYASWMVRGLPEVGDVLVTTEAPLGESAQIETPHIALAQRIILLKADKSRLTNEYLKYHFASASGTGELWSRATGSTAVGIKASHLRETLITVPPLKEQQAIVEHVRSEVARLDALAARVNAAIETLREYRAALISAAVTGKIAVRGEIQRFDFHPKSY
jgi:type I restriction enzyme, S subunit